MYRLKQIQKMFPVFLLFLIVLCFWGCGHNQEPESQNSISYNKDIKNSVVSYSAIEIDSSLFRDIKEKNNSRIYIYSGEGDQFIFSEYFYDREKDITITKSLGVFDISKGSIVNTIQFDEDIFVDHAILWNHDIVYIVSSQNDENEDERNWNVFLWQQGKRILIDSGTCRASFSYFPRFAKIDDTIIYSYENKVAENTFNYGVKRIHTATYSVIFEKQDKLVSGKMDNCLVDSFLHSNGKEFAFIVYDQTEPCYIIADISGIIDTIPLDPKEKIFSFGLRQDALIVSAVVDQQKPTQHFKLVSYDIGGGKESRREYLDAPPDALFLMTSSPLNYNLAFSGYNDFYAIISSDESMYQALVHIPGYAKEYTAFAYMGNGQFLIHCMESDIPGLFLFTMDTKSIEEVKFLRHL